MTVDEGSSRVKGSFGSGGKAASAQDDRSKADPPPAARAREDKSCWAARARDDNPQEFQVSGFEFQVPKESRSLVRHGGLVMTIRESCAGDDKFRRGDPTLSAKDADKDGAPR